MTAFKVGDLVRTKAAHPCWTSRLSTEANIEKGTLPTLYEAILTGIVADRGGVEMYFFSNQETYYFREDYLEMVSRVKTEKKKNGFSLFLKEKGL
jgi:hypothetical protein